jgi:hypothetical protein
MTIAEAKQKIFNRLCQEHKKPSSDGWVNWPNLAKELAIPERDFSDSLTELRGNGNHDLYIELDRTHEFIRLGASWRSDCDRT